MKKLLVTLLAAGLSLAVGMAHANFVINPYAVRTQSTFDLSLTASAHTTNTGSSFTLSAVSIGVAAEDRIVAWSPAYDDGNSITAVTIGGITATQRVAASNADNKAEIWTATVPTGTTADIVVTCNGTVSEVGWGAYRIVGAGSEVPNDTDFAEEDAVASTSLTALTVPSGGGAIIVASESNDTAVNWTSATEQFEFILSSFSLATGALTTTAGTNTITATVISGTEDWGLAGAAWGP